MIKNILKIGAFLGLFSFCIAADLPEEKPKVEEPKIKEASRAHSRGSAGDVYDDMFNGQRQATRFGPEKPLLGSKESKAKGT